MYLNKGATMNTQLVATIYGAVLHVAAFAAVTAALLTGHIDQTVGAGFLGSLIGFAVGVPVTIAATAKTVDVVPPPVAPPAA
jgi:hypothetical protein